MISCINPQKLMAVFIDGGGGEVLFSYAFLSKDSLPMSEDKESFAGCDFNVIRILVLGGATWSTRLILQAIMYRKNLLFPSSDN